MDKNTIIGFVLIAAVVIGFSLLNQPSQEELARQQHYRDSVEQVRQLQIAEEAKIEAQLQDTKEEKQLVENFFEPAKDNKFLSDSVVASASIETVDTTEIQEEIVSLENELLKIDFSTKGGQMVRAHLKNYDTYTGDSLYLFNNDVGFSLELENKLSTRLYTKDAHFTPVKGDGSLTMRLNYSPHQYIDFIYSVAPNSYMVKFDVNVVGMAAVLSQTSKEKFVFTWEQDLQRKEKSIKNEQQYSHIYYKNIGQNVNDLSSSSNVNENINEPVKWVAFKDQFFASVIIADKSFDITVLDSKILNSESYLKKYKAELYSTPEVENNDSYRVGFKFFFGPLKYAMLKDLDDGVKDKTEILELDKLVPLGWTLFRWVNQYFIIPIFNLLNKTGLGMGIIILLLTVIVKIIISPLTYKSYLSSAKMRVLRPQVEEINEKFPKQEQAMERQRATMELYSRAGASPLSGCMPMLLQMPILIALFAFFPSAIELRHQSFLWADDLSTYDAVLEWSGNIPIISSILGNHISLFCLLMTITNIVYTKFNMDMTNTGQQQMPGMKWMMMLMPVVFLFVLNNFPSGLTYYYFVSTLITILLTLGFRYFIDEEALLKKMEENKKKPKKKSGFLARLEEAQRQQQQQLQQQRNKGKGNRKK